GAAEANRFARLLEDLRMHGHAFSASVKTLEGRVIRANGWVMGTGTALRLRPASLQPEALPQAADEAAMADNRAILDGLDTPAFLRNRDGELVYANAAYHGLAKALGRATSAERPADLAPPGAPQKLEFDGERRFELVECALSGGHACYLCPIAAETPRLSGAESGQTHISGIIAALATPIAIFNARRELVQYNPA